MNTSCFCLIMMITIIIKCIILQIQIFGGSKMFSRKMIGQISVDLTALNVSRDKTHCQWYTLSKPEL